MSRKRILNTLLACVVSFSASVSLSACDVELLQSVNTILKSSLDKIKADLDKDGNGGAGVGLDVEETETTETTEKTEISEKTKSKRASKPVKDTKAENIDLGGCWTYQLVRNLEGTKVTSTETVTFKNSGKDAFTFSVEIDHKATETREVLKETFSSGDAAVTGNTADLTYNEFDLEQTFIYDVDETHLVALLDGKEKPLVYERCGS